MIRFTSLWIVLFALNWAPGRSVAGQEEKPRFLDVTEQAGIDFRYTFGDFTYDNILESSGSGVTVFDYDGDGDLDLYLLNGTYLEDVSDPKGRVFRDTPDRLYRNNGDGTFTELGQEAGLDDPYWSMAAVPVDYDGDGDVDLFLLNYGPNRFFLNNGNGTFSDIAPEIGLAGPEMLHGFTKWSVSGAFWDYDGDGDLDVMVGNFLAFDPYYLAKDMPQAMPHPSAYRGQASLLFEQGSEGKFVDVTQKAGMYYPDSKCMGLTVFDYDDDGLLDVFQGNDHQLNFLFHRRRDGTFAEVGVTAGVAANDEGHPTGSMHGSVGDVDGDGHLDLMVVDLEYGSLYRNLASGLFEDITARSGLKQVFMGKGAWGAALFDYDNDGDLDIFSANGMADLLVDQDQLLLENDGQGRFSNVGPQRSAYFGESRSARGATVWDYDNDGDLDIIVSHIDLRGTAALLRNDGGNRNHWLGVTLVGQNPAAASGAKLTVSSGDLVQVAVNQCGSGYLSYKDPRLHFGLRHRQQVDRLEVRWSDGYEEVFEDVAADRYVTIVEGQGVRRSR
ncbi:MAG: CRTAC1 family protein [Pirellulaceae bacterium]